jgi:hypothetical protein
MASETMLIQTWQSGSGFVAFFVIAVIGIWRSKKEQNPLAAAVIRFKYSTIAFAAMLSALLLSLPSTGGWMYRDDFQLESLPEATRYLRDLGLAVSRLNNVVHESLQFFIIWLATFFAFVSRSFSFPK